VSLSPVQWIISLGSVALQFAIMFLMIRRRLRTDFPMFFAYLGFNAAIVLVGLATYLFAFRQYFYVYWTVNTLTMLASFAVLYEVFAILLKPFSAVVDLGKMLFFWAGLFVLLAAVLTAVVTAGPGPQKLVALAALCDRCMHLMQCGFLMLLLIFEKRLNFSWRSSGMIVGLGMGMNAALDLAVSYGEHLVPSAQLKWDMVSGFSLIAVLLFWVIALWTHQGAPKTVNSTPSRLILQRWNEALISYGYGEAAVASGRMESFLPGIEKTVERVLARKIAN